MFLYRDILKRSAQITWKNKYLWFFGLFASLLAGTGRLNLSFSGQGDEWSGNIFGTIGRFLGVGSSEGLLHSIALYYKYDPVSTTIFLIFFCITCFLFLFLFWMAVVSQAGLVSDSAKIIKSGKSTESSATIASGMNAGTKKFWPVAGINIVTALLAFLFSAMVGAPLVFMPIGQAIDLMLLYVILFVVLIPLVLIVSFLGKFAVCFSVIKGKKFIDSLEDAVKLFGKNWLISVEMALIIFFIDFIAIFAIGLTILILAVPYLFAAIALAMIFSQAVFWLAVVVGLVLAIIIVILAGSVLTTFHTIAWTDIFINLTEKKGSLAKIIRVAEGMKK
jgi:hypothetical protein